MAFDFSKFDEQLDDKFLDEVKEAGERTTEFEEVPMGSYDVRVEKMEMVETKTAPARPMLTVWFKINDGEYKNQLIFMNQVLTHPFSIHIALEFLKSLEPTNLSEEDITFMGYEQFADLILECYEGIEGKREYQLNVDKNDKGFDVFKIEDIFDVE